jgi:hypothetical protein
VGARQSAPGLGLDGHCRQMMSNRVVEFARELVALAELRLLDVADASVGVEADRRAESGGEQEEPVPGHHLANAGLVGDVRDDEPDQDDPKSDPGLSAGTPAEQRVRQHECARDAPQQSVLVGREDPRDIDRSEDAEGDHDRGKRVGPSPRQHERDQEADGEQQGTGRHANSSRSSASRTDHVESSPRRTQSRHTSTGGCSGRGSAHNARTTFPNMVTA